MKLDKILRQYWKEKQPNLSLFTYSWEKLVGKEIAKITRPVKLKDGTLVISTKNSSLANELTFHSEEIKKQINLSLKSDTIKEVRVIGSGLTGDR